MDTASADQPISRSDDPPAETISLKWKTPKSEVERLTVKWKSPEKISDRSPSPGPPPKRPKKFMADKNRVPYKVSLLW